MAEGGRDTLRESASKTSETKPAGPHLYLVMRAHRPTGAPIRLALEGVDEVVIGRGELAVESRDGGRALVVTEDDPRMSVAHAKLSRRLGRWILEDTGSSNGTLVGGVKTGLHNLADGDVFELGRSFFIYRDAVPPGGASPERGRIAVGSVAPAPGLETMLAELAEVFAVLARVAASDVSILIRGETGTGKELVARAVHALSGRRGELVPVNCAALPDELIESELFGSRRGAFSGATEDRPGLVRSAHQGTLFLDEIAELPLASQSAFLRVLQEREVVPVGDTRRVKVDLRLVAATHADLDARVAGGDFRADLRNRLHGYELELPPLRRRREDLGLIVAGLLQRLAPGKADTVSFRPQAVRLLLGHTWPGNVRELQAALASALAVAGDAPLDVEHFPGATGAPPPSEALDPADQQRRDELIELFRAHNGNIHAVARATGKARMQIQRWIKRYGIDPKTLR